MAGKGRGVALNPPVQLIDGLGTSGQGGAGLDQEFGRDHRRGDVGQQRHRRRGAQATRQAIQVLQRRLEARHVFADPFGLALQERSRQIFR
jgi:hypothetical protein